MKAVDTLLAGLIDYAGVYPPASLSLESAVQHYLAYARGNHAAVLGRFVIGLDRLDELRSAAESSLRDLRLSVVAAEGCDLAAVRERLAQGFRIEVVEMKGAAIEPVAAARKSAGAAVEWYWEVPVTPLSEELLDKIARIGTRVKLRTGGVVADAIPSAERLGAVVRQLADRRIAFKATAGLHHAIRGRHALAYAGDAPKATMHGFLNLFCVAALLYDGGSEADARVILEDEDWRAFCLNEQNVHWRDQNWNEEKIAEVRRNFFVSFGSCSFDEPLQDLETMGWL